MPDFAEYLPLDAQLQLNRVANALVAPGKGILAADQKTDSFGRRFEAVGAKNTEENRRRYREMLFSMQDDVGKNVIGGVILNHEAFYQKTSAGVPFPQLLQKKGIKVGITPDKGLVPLAGFTEGETSTQGLDQLSERLAQYRTDGAEFCKWYCGLNIGPQSPSHTCMVINANVHARYASICQQNNLVPVVEPAVSSSGDHDLETAQKVTEQVMSYTYKALHDHHVLVEGTVLKASMVVPGIDCKKQYTPDEIARATLTALRRSVPVAVPGVGFLSGGLSEEISTRYLDAINRCPGIKPWPLTFCFGRALQGSVMEIWKSKDENRAAAQNQFVKLAKANSQASLGRREAI